MGSFDTDIFLHYIALYNVLLFDIGELVHIDLCTDKFSSITTSPWTPYPNTLAIIFYMC